MKSPCCKTPIEIRTNPKEADYDAVAGVRRTLRSLVGRRRTAEDEAGTAEDVGGAGRAEEREEREEEDQEDQEDERVGPPRRAAKCPSLSQS